MNIIREIEQGTDQWHELRIGKVTASKMKDVLSKGRGTAPSKTAETYMFDLLFWVAVGLVVGWNLPQPWWAKMVQEKIVGKIRGWFAKKD